MLTYRSIALSALLLCVACDEKKETPTSAASPSASAAERAAAVSAAPSVTAAPSAVTAASAAPSAAPAATSTTSMITGDAKDVVLTVKDPAKESEKTIKAQTGGSVTLFLPDYPGTVWSVETNDKSLGKAKEEVIPGFAPGTNGHQFKWTTAAPTLKAGEKHKVIFGNKKLTEKTGKPTTTFTLTIELT